MVPIYKTMFSPYIYIVNSLIFYVNNLTCVHIHLFACTHHSMHNNKLSKFIYKRKKYKRLRMFVLWFFLIHFPNVTYNCNFFHHLQLKVLFGRQCFDKTTFDYFQNLVACSVLLSTNLIIVYCFNFSLIIFWLVIVST
jgi:hypothetical protein